MGTCFRLNLNNIINVCHFSPWSVCIFAWKPYSDPRALCPATKIETLEHHVVLNYGIVYRSDRRLSWNSYYNRFHFYTPTMPSAPTPVAPLVHPLYRTYGNWSYYGASDQPGKFKIYKEKNKRNDCVFIFFFYNIK